ncbi:MAG TPA: hypothetical protein ENN38_04660 [Actinobacteria bacterium]|nr:hypothetical protein [Actinomycetota bacterium]
MSTKKPLLIYSMIFSVAFILCGCGGSSGDNVKPPAEDVPVTFHQKKNGLEIDFLVSKEGFSVGEDVSLKLSIKNTNSNTRVLNFTSGQKYDFLVEDSSGREVWRWSYDKSFTMALEEKKLEPGEQLTYEVIWPQKDLENKQVLAGDYLVKGFCSAMELKDVILSLEIKVVD